MLGGSRTHKMLLGHALPVQADPWLCLILSSQGVIAIDRGTRTHGRPCIWPYSCPDISDTTSNASRSVVDDDELLRIYAPRGPLAYIKAILVSSLSSRVTGIAASAEVLYTF